MSPELTLTDPVPRVLVKEEIASGGVDMLRREGFDVELGFKLGPRASSRRRIGDFDAILIRSGNPDGRLS